MGFVWLYAKLRHPGRAILFTASTQLFADYADYLLGEEVFGLRSRDPQGHVVTSPSWALVLSYEREIRREVARKLQDGHDLEMAFR
eukprot:11903549-Heterocapsa_arctica.AAC.1